MRIRVSTRDGYGLERVASSWLTAPLDRGPCYYLATYLLPNSFILLAWLAPLTEAHASYFITISAPARWVGGSVRRTRGWVYLALVPRGAETSRHRAGGRDCFSFTSVRFNSAKRLRSAHPSSW